MRVKKMLSCLMVGALCTIMFVGCGKPNDATNANGASPEITADAEGEPEEAIGDVTLTLGYWGSSGEDKAFAKAIEGIQDAYPEIMEVKLQQYPSVDEFYQRLPGEIAAGTAPDIVNITNEQHLQLIDQGLILPLDDYKFDMSALSETAVNVWNYDGKQFGIPTTSAPATFVVNDDMWKAAGLTDYPKTWEDVYNAAKVLTTDDVTGLCLDIGNIYHPTQYMNSFGGGWKDGSAINSKENVEALEYIFKLFKEGLAITAKNAGKSWDGEVFAAQQSAMTTGGTWYVGAMNESAPDVNYSFIPMPGGNGENGSTLHSYAYAIIKGTEQAELAAKAALYMSRAEYQEANAEIAGARPSDASVMDKFLELNPNLVVLSEYESTATGFGYPSNVEFQTSFLSALESVIYGGADTSAQEILDTLAENYGK